MVSSAMLAAEDPLDSNSERNKVPLESNSERNKVPLDSIQRQIDLFKESQPQL